MISSSGTCIFFSVTMHTFVALRKFFELQAINIAVHQSVFEDSVTLLGVYIGVQLYRHLSDPRINISIALMLSNCFHGLLHKICFFSLRS